MRKLSALSAISTISSAYKLKIYFLSIEVFNFINAMIKTLLEIVLAIQFTNIDIKHGFKLGPCLTERMQTNLLQTRRTKD